MRFLSSACVTGTGADADFAARASMRCTASAAAFSADAGEASAVTSLTPRRDAPALSPPTPPPIAAPSTPPKAPRRPAFCRSISCPRATSSPIEFPASSPVSWSPSFTAPFPICFPTSLRAAADPPAAAFFATCPEMREAKVFSAAPPVKALARSDAAALTPAPL